MAFLLLLGDDVFFVVATGDADETDGSKAESGWRDNELPGDPSTGHPAGVVKGAAHSSSSSSADDDDDALATGLVVLGEVGTEGTPATPIEGIRGQLLLQ